jgi:ABC-type nitrate/sulfonate/bicarbonate transport system permease component
VAAATGSRRRLRARVVQTAFVAVTLVLWYVASTQGMVNPLILPALPKVGDAFVTIVAHGDFLPDLRVTLTELVCGYVIAVSLGSVVGFIVSRRRYTIRAFDPLIAGLAAVPLILFLPLYVMFFGIGIGSKIAIGATIAFFPVAMSTIAGFGNVEPLYLTAARAMGASNAQLFRDILLPAALPVILGGLRMGFILCFLSILGSETIISFAGLGHKIVELGESMDTPRMFGYIAFVVIIAVALNVTVTALERRGRRQ